MQLIIVRAVLFGLALCLFSSCAVETQGDFREVVSASGTEEPVVEAAPGLSPLTASQDSENLFFCPSPDARWGIFASNRHSHNLRLYRIDLKRAGLLYAISGASEGNNIFPALNAAGRLLAFVSDRDGIWRIYLLPLEPHAVPEPATPPGEDTLCPAWDPRATPGQERLAYCRYNVREERWEVCILDRKTGQLAHLGPGLFPAWSPDGAYLAVQRARARSAAQFSLWLVRVDGSEPDRELYMSEKWAAANPCWSPDGKYLAFNTVGRGRGESLAGDGGGIYILPLSGPGGLRGPLPGGDSLSWRPAWAPTGTIYFHRREGEAVNVLSVQGPPLDMKAAGETELADRL